VIGGWFHVLGTQVGITGGQFTSAFSAGLWAAQKFGSVVGAVLVTAINLISDTIQSVLMLANVLADIATGHFSQAAADFKGYVGNMARNGEAIKNSWGRVLQPPDYSPAARAAAQYQANLKVRTAQETLTTETRRSQEIDTRLEETKRRISVSGSSPVLAWLSHFEPVFGGAEFIFDLSATRIS